MFKCVDSATDSLGSKARVGILRLRIGVTAVLLSDVTGEPAAAACSTKLRGSANFWQNWMEFMEALASS